MNPELEALVKAYDAAIQAQGSESERLEAIYESLLAAAVERHSNISIEALDSTIQLSLPPLDQSAAEVPDSPSAGLTVVSTSVSRMITIASESGVLFAIFGRPGPVSRFHQRLDRRRSARHGYGTIHDHLIAYAAPAAGRSSLKPSLASQFVRVSYVQPPKLTLCYARPTIAIRSERRDAPAPRSTRSLKRSSGREKKRAIGVNVMNSVFLKAEWRYLAMLNFVVDPAILRPLVPRGTELDFYDDRTYVSIVGFRFMRTRVFGISFPFHRNFEEVNLRFYIRRKKTEGWRRGVVFVRELVPRWAIAFIARTIYGEAYTALPMRHKIELSESKVRVEYGWLHNRKWERLHVSAAGQPKNPEIGSKEEFITEHYWGYTGGDLLSEYQVEHPPWRVWRGTDAGLEADVGELYGAQFVESLSARPTSAFIAEGSVVTVRCKSDVLPASH